MIDGPVARPLLAARDAGADEEQPALLAARRARRIESSKFELPPSMTMSPGSRCGSELLDRVVDGLRPP